MKTTRILTPLFFGLLLAVLLAGINCQAAFARARIICQLTEYTVQ